MLARANTLIGWLVKAGGVIGVACIFALTLLTVATVAARAMNIAFPGTYALSEILLIPAISFSLCYAAWTGAHTRVEFVTGFLPERLSQVLDGLIDLVALVFWVAICRAVWLQAIKMTARNETAAIIDVPAWPFRWLMVAALVLTCIVLVMRALLSFAGRPREEERSH